MNNWRWAFVTCTASTILTLAFGILFSFAAWRIDLFISWGTVRYIVGFWLLTYLGVAAIEAIKSFSKTENR